MQPFPTEVTARVLTGFAILLAFGCDDDGPVCDEYDGPNVLEIGDTSLTTPAEFVPLEPGDRMRVVITAHGQYAMRPAIRVRGLWPGEAGRVGHADDPRVDIQAYLGETFVGGTNVSAQTGLVLDDAPRYGLTTTTEGAELLGVELVFLEEIDPLDYLNEIVELRGDVTDACNETASARIDVVAHWQY